MIGDLAAQPFSIARGRRAALLVFGIFAGLELSVLLGYLVRVGPDKLVQHIIRLGIAMLLGWALVRRHAWARWVILALLAFGFVSSAVPFFQVVRNGPPAALAVLAILWGGYLVMGGILIWSRDLRGYVTVNDQR